MSNTCKPNMRLRKMTQNDVNHISNYTNLRKIAIQIDQDRNSVQNRMSKIYFKKIWQTVFVKLLTSYNARFINFVKIRTLAKGLTIMTVYKPIHITILTQMYKKFQANLTQSLECLFRQTIKKALEIIVEIFTGKVITSIMMREHNRLIPKQQI